MYQKDICDYPRIVNKGIFLREDRYRFHCWVMVNGEEVLCYLPSNCKLEKIISLKGKTVLLSEYLGANNKFKYKVEAVLNRKSQVLLNLCFLNRVIEQQLSKKIFSFLGARSYVVREKKIGGYKSDLYINNSNTIIEIKSVLSFGRTVVYPQNYSKHMLEQLEQLQSLVREGITVFYFIVGLGPALKEINIDIDSSYGRLMKESEIIGIRFVGLNLCSRNGKYKVNSCIPINYVTKDA